MNCFYENGLHFSCQRCSRCCRLEPGFVYLSETDLTNLCQWFKFTRDQFISMYCRVVPYYDGANVLCLREKKNYDCILWDEGCRAYGARPVQCSTYPFWTWVVKDRQAWELCGRDCPGINEGRFWNKSEIEKQRKMYELNEPIRVP